MAVQLLSNIDRYLVDLDDDLDALTTSRVGSRAYSKESTSWFIFDGSAWTALTAELAAVDLDAVLAQSTGQDVADALTGATTPSSSNVYATVADLTGILANLLATYVADGQDETSDATITVTGIGVGDLVAGCIVFATKASIASLANRAASDFAVTGINEITVGAHKANTTSNQYVFFVIKAQVLP